MKGYIITTGTVTYAIKGRDLLRKKGINAKIERITSGKGSAGCGYSIIINGDVNEAVSILRSSGVKILEIRQGHPFIFGWPCNNSIRALG